MNVSLLAEDATIAGPLEAQYGGQNNGGLILMEAAGMSVGPVSCIINVSWLAGGR